MGKWTVLLIGEAERDYAGVIRWTAERFGARQAEIYQEMIEPALAALSDGPNVPGSRARDEIGANYRTLHISHGRRRGRHIVLYRQHSETEIAVVRILHDGMDLARHLPASFEEP